MHPCPHPPSIWAKPISKRLRRLNIRPSPHPPSISAGGVALWAAPIPHPPKGDGDRYAPIPPPPGGGSICTGGAYGRGIDMGSAHIEGAYGRGMGDRYYMGYMG